MTYTSQRFTYLDGLRAFAIVQVVWFHLWIVSWYGASPLKIWGYTILNTEIFVRTGYLGVETFLFLSACCLTIPIASSLTSVWSKDFWKGFARKRFFKIVPSYYFSILVVLLFGSNTYQEWSVFVRDLLTHVFFIHNLSASTYGSINGVYWSLGLEVQFYCLFPALIWAFLRRPLLVSLSLCVVSFVFKLYCLKVLPNENNLLSNSLVAFLDTFCTGMIAGFCLGRGVIPRSRATCIILLAIGLLCLYWSISIGYEWTFKTRGIDEWKTFFRLPYGLSLLLIIVGLQGTGGFLPKVLGSRPFVFASSISYNLYIWHGILFQEMLNRKIPVQRTVDIHQDPVWQVRYFWSCLFASLVVSTLVTYLMEKPIMKKYLR